MKCKFYCYYITRNKQIKLGVYLNLFDVNCSKNFSQYNICVEISRIITCDHYKRHFSSTGVWIEHHIHASKLNQTISFSFLLFKNWNKIYISANSISLNNLHPNSSKLKKKYYVIRYVILTVIYRNIITYACYISYVKTKIATYKWNIDEHLCNP